MRIHDCRHSYASHALALGESLPIIGRLLGHTQVETTARYAHLAQDSVRTPEPEWRTVLRAIFSRIIRGRKTRDDRRRSRRSRDRFNRITEHYGWATARRQSGSHRRRLRELTSWLKPITLMVWTPPFRRRVRQNGVWFELQTEGASTMDITTIGFDLAKTVFQVHGADGEGRAVLRRKLRRGKVLAFFAGLPSCLVGMEACASAHYWAREIQALGHEVRLIPPQYVRPFVKTNKNDAADAEAICEAVTRPTMRFAPAKSAEQQSVLMLHRARELLVRQRTMVINALRGHCAELGLIVAQGASKVEELVAIIEDPGDVRLPPLAREALGSLVEQLHSAQARIKQLEATLLAWHRSNQASRRLATIPGVGVITATALVATIGDGAQFRSGRQLSAWLGLVPRQHSSGGKDRLGRISKRGDGYIRRLLVHGARSVLRWRRAKPGTGPGWSDRLLARRPTNVVLVAMANKTARVAWALLRYERIYRPTPA